MMSGWKVGLHHCGCRQHLLCSKTNVEYLLTCSKYTFGKVLIWLICISYLNNCIGFNEMQIVKAHNVFCWQQIHGTVRVIMRPLINVIPIIGGLEICFISQPVSEKLESVINLQFCNCYSRTTISELWSFQHPCISLIGCYWVLSNSIRKLIDSQQFLQRDYAILKIWGQILKNLW